MTPRPSPLRGRWLPATLAVAALALVFLFLAGWQWQRRAERLAANQRILDRLDQPALTVTGEPLDPEAADLRRATVRGRFDYGEEVILRNRTWNGFPGVNVLTPLLLSDSEGAPVAILVDRGWIPYESSAPEQRAAFQFETGEVEVQGILRQSQQRRSNLAPEDPVPTAGSRVDAWHRVDLEKIAAQLPYELLPVYLEEDERPRDPARPFPRPQPEISLDEGSHLVYAIQWLAFAVIAVAGYAALFWQRTRAERESG